jgi:hypothetical protein
MNIVHLLPSSPKNDVKLFYGAFCELCLLMCYIKLAKARGKLFQQR